MIIAVDPGANIGVATFTLKGEDYNKGVFSEENFLNFMASLLVAADQKPDIIFKFIVEPFTLRQDLAIEQTGSNMPASRIIGAIQMVDRILGDKSEIHYSPASNLKSALKWSGMNKYLSYRHVPDEIAAYAHGVMWLIQNDYRKHPIFS